MPHTSEESGLFFTLIINLWKNWDSCTKRLSTGFKLPWMNLTLKSDTKKESLCQLTTSQGMSSPLSMMKPSVLIPSLQICILSKPKILIWSKSNTTSPTIANGLSTQQNLKSEDSYPSPQVLSMKTIPSGWDFWIMNIQEQRYSCLKFIEKG